MQRPPVAQSNHFFAPAISPKNERPSWKPPPARGRLPTSRLGLDFGPTRDRAARASCLPATFAAGHCQPDCTKRPSAVRMLAAKARPMPCFGLRVPQNSKAAPTGWTRASNRTLVRHHKSTSAHLIASFYPNFVQIEPRLDNATAAIAARPIQTDRSGHSQSALNRRIGRPVKL